MSSGMFDGVRVVELAQYVFVPAASVLLADQGAEVIKIEIPQSGDPYRSLRVGDGREVGAVNLAMEQNNRGKKSVALDLKTETGREAFLALIATADVFVTSLRPRAIRSLRVDVDDLRAVNPRLIYARGNGLGFKGDEADKPGFDASSFWARGGMAYVMSPPGQGLTPPRPALGDHSGSVSLAYGIAAALFKRAQTGEPSVVETSLLSMALWMLSADVTYSQSPDYVAHRNSRFPLMSAYATRDGRLIQLMLLDPEPHWPALCHLLGRAELADDPRFANNLLRMENCEALISLISTAIAERDWADWRPLFVAFDAPWELIQSVEELSDDPQVLANGMIVTSAAAGQPVRLVAGPVRFDNEALSQQMRAAPALGEHTDEILGSLG